VGVATLAFTSSPADNLMNIARGASLGLYAGIILGTYLVYAPEDSENPNGTVNPEAPEPSTDGANSSRDPLHGFALYPTVQNNSIGINANLFTLRF